MTTESGRVIGIGDDVLWLETVQRSTCGACSANKVCGQGIANRLTGGRRNQLKVAMGRFSARDFSLNDEVVVSIPDRVLLAAAFVVYLVPLLAMVLGMVLLGQWLPGDLGSLIGAALGFVLGLAMVKVHAVLVAANPQYLPVVVRIVGPVLIPSTV